VCFELEETSDTLNPEKFRKAPGNITDYDKNWDNLEEHHSFLHYTNEF
jgi:hypothetical protein